MEPVTPWCTGQRLTNWTPPARAVKLFLNNHAINTKAIAFKWALVWKQFKTLQCGGFFVEHLLECPLRMEFLVFVFFLTLTRWTAFTQNAKFICKYRRKKQNVQSFYGLRQRHTKVRRGPGGWGCPRDGQPDQQIAHTSNGCFKVTCIFNKLLVKLIWRGNL